jgi:hypothetical protein
MAMSKRVARLREIEDKWLHPPGKIDQALREDIVALAMMIREMEYQTDKLLKFHRQAYDKLKAELYLVRKIAPHLCICKTDPGECPVHRPTSTDHQS